MVIEILRKLAKLPLLDCDPANLEPVPEESELPSNTRLEEALKEGSARPSFLDLYNLVSILLLYIYRNHLCFHNFLF